MYKIRTLTLLAVAALLASALTPTAALAVSREAALARGRVWLSAGVPYSQARWALEDGSITTSTTVGYRTDCSGFVSLCWNLRDSRGRAYSTSTWEMGKNNSPYFQLVPIAKGELQPGDMILKSKVWYTGSGSGHAIIFAGWSKADGSEYWALEQTGPRTKYSRRPYGQSGYRPFRYNGFDGFDRTRLSYGQSFTVNGVAASTQLQNGAVSSQVATGGVADLAVFGGDGALSYLVSDTPVDINGRFAISYTPARSATYAVRFRDQIGSDPDPILFPTYVTVAPYLTAVSGNRSKIARRRTYTFTGYTNPRVATSLRIYKYNAKKRKYLPYTSANAKVGSSMSSNGCYKFTARWKPRVKGKYRLNWLTAAPEGMGASASGSRYITVK